MLRTNKHVLSAWQFIVWFGVVSLFADFVYEGARAVTGPYMAHLGASAALIGVVTGAGEAIALAGRLITGPLVDKTRAYWPLAIAGYLLTIVSVPLLGATTTLLVASTLIITERIGKAVRSPGKDVMLSHATAAIGRGKGFSVHEALDQTGAVLGPLLVAVILGTTHNSYQWAFSALAIPGLIVVFTISKLRQRVPDPSVYDHRASKTFTIHDKESIWSFSREFWLYVGFTIVATIGFGTFGVLSYHLVKHHIVSTPLIPVVYAITMGIAGGTSLVSGLLYDHIGRRSLFLVPLLTAAIPFFAFATTPIPVIIGILLWGCVTGIQESTMRAAVADITPAQRRGTAYGVFALGFGTASLIGGGIIGYLYDTSIHTLTYTVLTIEIIALICFVATQLKHTPQPTAHDVI